MTRKNVSKIICDWIRAILSHRIVTSCQSDENIIILAARDCPQGGILSPLLWSPNGWVYTLGGWRLRLQAFVDDQVMEGRHFEEYCVKRLGTYS